MPPPSGGVVLRVQIRFPPATESGTEKQTVLVRAHHEHDDPGLQMPAGPIRKGLSVIDSGCSAPIRTVPFASKSS